MYHGQVEGTDLVVLDKRFGQLFAGYMRVTRHWTGPIWAEGPAWFAAGRYLIWSDIPNNRMLRFARNRAGSVFRRPPTIRTAIRSTTRAGWSPASI